MGRMRDVSSPAWQRYWVITCLLLVFSMVVIGGLTRLTESGLSIVEWKLVSGILPPLTQEGWNAEFAAYQATPEYIKENRGMSLGEFKGIFWLEYLHRLLGRTVGLVVLAPLAWLWARRLGEPWFRRRMTLVAGLIGLQGTIGWYMVKSGLIDVPWVSPYRLALHLSVAVIIFGVLLVTWLRLRDARHAELVSASFQKTLKRVQSDNSYLPWLAPLTLVALFLQIILGAFVAGLDAGFTYNTFPLMDGDFIPAEMRALEPALRHYLENIAAVQFFHRWWAFAVLALVLATAWQGWRSSLLALRRLGMAMVSIAALQVVLGILTLLWVVPVGLGTLHQAVAVLLFGVVLWFNYRILRRKTVDSLQNLTTINATPATA
jgi:cytochrome c oxidase assembly protein subunit 15